MTHMPHKFGKWIVAIGCSLGTAVVVAMFFYLSGVYLQGNSYFTWLHSIDLLKEARQAGQLYPLYTLDWNNGYETFQYTSPMVAMLWYEFAMMFHGDVHSGICLYYGVLAFLAVFGFMLLGMRRQQMVRAWLAGVVYLFLPTTIRLVIGEGDLALAFELAFLPLLLFFLLEFLQEKIRLAIVPITLLFLLMILAHYPFSFVLGGVLIVYLVLSGIGTRSWCFELVAAVNFILLYFLAGRVLYPAMSSGILEQDYAGKIGQKTPIVLLILAVAMLATTVRERMAYCVLSVLLLLLAIPGLAPVRRLLPFLALRNAVWFELLGGLFCLLALFCWKKLKFLVFLLFMAIAVSSGVATSLALQPGSKTLATGETVLQEYMLDEAVQLTQNRLTLLDNGLLGSLPHWYFAGQGVNELSGGEEVGAVTGKNQAQIREAFADGLYAYVFDRLCFYGSDTVVILKEVIEPEADGAVMSAARQNGYSMVAENDKIYLLRLDAVDGNYGVVTHYENLAIGETGFYISYLYPSFGQGRSNVLEDYTIDELKGYKRLYLSGFTYRDKQKAESMLKELSRKGVKIYVDMQNIPVNRLSGKDEFMDVYAQFIQFTKDFPILENENGNQFRLDVSTRANTVWNTVYVSGCDQVIRETKYEGRKHLAYLGKKDNYDITFIGFNLVYYYLETHNQDLLRFLNDIMELSEGELSTREIVPITVTEENGQIVVDSEQDHVNSNLAAVAMMQPDRVIQTEDNFWVVNEGRTVFEIGALGRKNGVLISIVGVIGLGLLWIAAYVLLEGKKREEVV